MNSHIKKFLLGLAALILFIAAFSTVLAFIIWLPKSETVNKIFTAIVFLLCCIVVPIYCYEVGSKIYDYLKAKKSKLPKHE